MTKTEMEKKIEKLEFAAKSNTRKVSALTNVICTLYLTVKLPEDKIVKKLHTCALLLLLIEDILDIAELVKLRRKER